MNATLNEAIHFLEYAWGVPSARGVIREFPEDFCVFEIPKIKPEGEGEHVWLLIRKRLENTASVADAIARFAGVPLRDVSFAGLKDRQAVTEQWFSVQLPGKSDPDWQQLNSEKLTVVEHMRHSRKLRRGTLSGNRFEIHIRNLIADRAQLEQRLQDVADHGVPNYFGEQRFGRHGSNLRSADELFRNPRKRRSRNQRSLALSAVRSLLFNQVLSTRVGNGHWNTAVPGDVMQLAGSHSFFTTELVDEELRQRVASRDIHPTGPLYGKGVNPAADECLALEQDILGRYPDWLNGLEAAGLRQDRRALRLPVSDLKWHWLTETDLQLNFSLPAGAYATAVLRELVSCNE